MRGAAHDSGPSGCAEEDRRHEEEEAGDPSDGARGGAGAGAGGRVGVIKRTSPERSHVVKPTASSPAPSRRGGVSARVCLGFRERVF